MTEDKIKVFENLIPLPIQNELESLFEMNDDIKWSVLNKISRNPDKFKFDKNIIEAPGASHILFWDGDIASVHFHAVKPILYYLEERADIKLDQLERIRVRKTFYAKGHDENKYTPPHVDLPELENYMSLVYYVHDTDGDTFFFAEEHEVGSKDTYLKKGTIIKRVSPKKGSAILFPGRTFHAGNSPINNNTRTIINFDFTTLT